MIDEGEVNDKKFMNVICGAIDMPDKTYLILCKPLENPANKMTVCQCIDDAIRVLDCPRDNFLILFTDAAAYNNAAAKILENLYPKLHHVTCFAHLIHNAAMKIKSNFQNVDNLIACVQASIVKNKTRRAQFSEIGTPPSVIVTRWSSWLKGALFYARNLPKVQEIVKGFEGSGVIVTKAKEALQDQNLCTDLLAIQRDYAPLIELIEKIQSSHYSIDRAWTDIQALLDEKLNQDICNIKPYLRKRLPQTGLPKIMNLSRQSEISPEQYMNMQKCQATTCAVERSFSILKKILRPDRPFSLSNISKYAILYYNHF